MPTLILVYTRFRVYTHNTNSKVRRRQCSAASAEGLKAAIGKREHHRAPRTNVKYT